MGNANKSKRDSNACVLEKSLDLSDEEMNDYPIDDNVDIKDDLKKIITLPIENECEELMGIPFDDDDDDEDMIKSNLLPDNKLKLSTNSNSHEFRSKSMVCNNNISLFNAPKQKLKIFNEPIIPFKLSNKTYGGSQWKNKKPNSIILHLSDSKSCNDTENTTEDIFYDNDFELETNIAIHNEEDVNDLPNCRKKMAIFRDSIDNKSDHSFNEEEQIEDILEGKKNKSNKQNKKSNFWTKHIKQQMLKSNLSMRFSKISEAPIKKSVTMKIKPLKNESANESENENNDDDLFILGVLESAAKEKKKKKKSRYTICA